MNIEFGLRNATGGIGLGFRLTLTLLFLFFVAFSVVFGIRNGTKAYENTRTFLWDETRCLILSSSVEQRRDDFCFKVEYRYGAGGRTHVSTLYSPDYGGSADYRSAARLSKRYRPESPAVCYVDPSDPSQAVLAHGSPWVALMMIFPLIFGTIGAGGLYFLWRGAARARKSDPQSTRVESISEAGDKKRGVALMYALFALFLVVGSVGFYFIGLQPAIRILLARDWIRTPCVVIDARVRSNTGSNSKTYRINILYSYKFKGKRYKSNQYNFVRGSTAEHDRKTAIVKRHPPGTLTVCWVNPDNPSDAVLDRSPSLEMLFGLVPLLFACIGGGGILYLTRERRRERGSIPGPTRGSPTIPYGAEPSVRVADRELTDGPLTLEVKKSRIWNVGFAVIIALIWNGVVSVFVRQAVQSWREGCPEWFLMVFLIPFVLIGIGTIVNVPYRILAFFSPRPVLILGRGTPRLGERTELTWKIVPRARAVKLLEIEVKGREEAECAESESTETNVFAGIPVARTNQHAEMMNGYATLEIPADSMHSFKSENNRIIWSIRVKGEIKFRPDIDDEFEITVRPQAARSGRALWED
jgi:hypothetical protein